MTIPASIAVALFTSVWILGSSGLIAWTLDAAIGGGRFPWRRAAAALASTTAGLAVVIYLAAGR